MRRTLSCWLIALVVALVVRAMVPVGAASWVNVTGNLAGLPSECGNLPLVSASPTSDRVIAGVALKGLWVNTTGTTWSQLGTGAGSATITNRPTWISYDPANPNVFYESGIYNGGGVYKTTDNGLTFRQLGSISHIDFVSVDYNDPNRNTLVAGGHEQSRTVYRSTDGGSTWTNVGANMPANSNFSTNPLVVNAQTYLVNTSGWGGGTNGIFRTTDSGATWQQVSTSGAQNAPLVASGGAIYWAFGNSVLKSTNAGVNWTQIGNGLQAVHPIEVAGGQLVSVGGSTLVMSSDGGATWTAIGPTLPYAPLGVVYSPTRKAFFIWHFDCANAVPADAIMRLDFDLNIPAPPTNLHIVSLAVGPFPLWRR
jgi:hypothetical protein